MAVLVPGFMPDDLFKALDAAEERSFRQWARDNWRIGEPASALWHPVVRDEWYRLDLALEELAATSTREPLA